MILPTVRRIGDARLALWLFCLALALRAVMPFLVPDGSYDRLLAAPAPDSPYRMALREHFFEFLWYDHTLPPLYTLKNGVLNALLPATWVVPVWYVMLVTLDALTTALAFRTMRLLGLHAIWAAIVATAISLRLLLWETWDWGNGWDAFNPFLVMLFCWAAVRFALSPDRPRAWTAGLCGGLLVTGFQFGLPAFIAIGVGIVILLAPRRGHAGMTGRLLIVPVALIAMVIGKNVTEHGLWSTSSGAGQNIIQNLNMALQDSEGHGALRLGIRNGYPAWWAWCYEEAERRRVHQVPNVAGFYGMCTFRQGGTRDFSGLSDWLAAHPDPHMEDVVSKDIAILRGRPWLWSGSVGDRATGTSIEYGKISQRLLFDVPLAYPRNFAGRVYMNLRIHFLAVGSQFLISVNRARFDEPAAIRHINAIAAPLFLVGFFAALFWFGAATLWRIVTWIRPPPHARDSSRLYALGAVSAGLIAVATVSAILACCENYRHAFCVLPVAMCLGAVAIADAASGIRRITKRLGFR